MYKGFELLFSPPLNMAVAIQVIGFR